MSRGISYKKEELSIISEAVQTFPDAKIEELVELIHQRIADVDISLNIPARTKKAINLKICKMRRYERVDVKNSLAIPKKEEKLFVITDNAVCEAIKLIKQAFIQSRKELADSKSREKDLKEQLRNLRDIRQAVEKYQKVFN